jgi:hypothetical protein
MKYSILVISCLNEEVIWRSGLKDVVKYFCIVVF